MNFKKLFNDIVSGIVANLAISVILAIGVALSPFIGPKTLIIASVVAIGVGVVKKCWSNTVHFKWWYTYRKNVHTFEICSKNKIKQTEKIYLAKRNRNFNSKITSEFIWDDVKVEKLEFECQEKVVVACTTIDNLGNQVDYRDENINFPDKFIGSAKYIVEFPFNNCADVSFSAEMEYDQNTAPEFFVDIERPVKNLIIEVKVFNGVQINNVKKKITPLYGEYNANSKRIKGVLIDSHDEIDCKVYTFKIRKPLLLHRYTICWEWIQR